MSKSICVTAVQLPAEPAGKSVAQKVRNNLHAIEEALDEAGRRQSDLVLFGEYANLWHHSTSAKRRDYVPEDRTGPALTLATDAARRFRMNVALPVFGTVGGALSSNVVLIDRTGSVSGVYQKTHLIIQEQRLGMKRGNNLPVFVLDCAKVGIMTCMDIEYPEVAQTLMLKGAGLLLFPHVQAGWGEVDWEIRYRARAIDTGLPLVSSCYGYPPGTWKPGKMIGRSGIVGRDGTILGDMGREIGCLTMDILLDRHRITHFFFEKSYPRTPAVIASRRPDLYTVLTSQKEKRRAQEALGVRDIVKGGR